MTGDDLLLDLSDPRAADAALAGVKAARLAELAGAGFPVPGGFVLTTRAHALAEGDAFPDALAGRVAQACARLHGPFAVRSSGTAEDLGEASFAGLYETVLGVAPGDVPAAIATCWASAHAPRVAAYRQARGVEAPPRMAVLVQEQVDARAAGVAFSANPRTGTRDETVIDAVRGLGERLVSGVANADAWVVRDGTAVEVARHEDAITAAEALDVAALARRVEARAGAPQDIEWALDARGLHLLQARPITVLPPPISWEAPAPGLWLRMFRLGEWLGEPITPLFETWLLDRMEGRLFARFEEVVPQPIPRPFHVTVNGWYFTTGNFTPRSVPHGLYLAVRYLLPAAICHPIPFSVLTTTWAHLGMARFEAAWRDGPAEAYETAVAGAEARVDHLPIDELLPLVDDLADHAGDEAFYFFLGGGSAWKAEAALAAFFSRHLSGRVDGTHARLLQGLRTEAPSAHAAVSLDWHAPTLGELAEGTGGAERRAEAARSRQVAEAEARAALDGRRRARFDVLLARAQHFGRLREEQADHLTLAWPVLRRAVARLGDALVARGVLSARDDVYFLLREELASGLAEAPLDAIAAARRTAWEHQRRLVPPAFVGTMRPIQRAIFEGSQRALAGGHPAEDAWLVGAPASPGRATGPARIIRSPEEFGRLAAGDVLVAPATNPGWTPLFARAAAVVTDTGSLMAHTSLVAREYALPAVVGCGDATRRIRDGQIVLVDGTTGRVEPVD